MNNKRILVGSLIAVLILIVIHSLNNWNDSAFGMSNTSATDRVSTAAAHTITPVHNFRVPASSTIASQDLASSKASTFSRVNSHLLPSNLAKYSSTVYRRNSNDLAGVNSSENNNPNNNILGINGNDENANGTNANKFHGLYGGGTLGVANSNQTGNGTIIYISDYLKNQIIACNIINGNFTNCQVTLVNKLNGPEGLLIVNNILYIANMLDNSITSCLLDNLGNITSCNNNHLSVGMLQSPIYLIYFGQRIHTADFVLNELATCSLDLSQCSPSSIKNNSLLMLYVQQYNNYSYSLGYESASKSTLISKCANIANVSCKFERNTLISNVSFFVLNSGYIYTDDYNKSAVVSCSLSATGDFTNCKTVSFGMASPTGMALYSTNANVTQLSNK